MPPMAAASSEGCFRRCKQHAQSRQCQSVGSLRNDLEKKIPRILSVDFGALSITMMYPPPEGKNNQRVDGPGRP